MLSFEDDRWQTLEAGYRVPVDLRPLLRRLEEAEDHGEVWPEVWEGLYHQGDVGEGSYVAVPHLVRIHRSRGVADWNVYALAAAIELARDTTPNPEVPGWAKESYEESLRELAVLGLEELAEEHGTEHAQSVLALLAVVRGLRVRGRILLEFTDDELEEMEALWLQA